MAEGAGMFTVLQTVGSVLCCKCGILIQPNAANMCVQCLCSEVDITEGLKKRIIIRHCPECDTYLQPPSSWIKAQLESKELLAYCIQILHLPKVVRLVNAEFIWTEPHSKRIKVRLRIQKEVLTGAVLEQAFVAEFVQQESLCESCTRVRASPDYWVASVQLRQHVSHRRTFFYLEQVILKHNAAFRAIKIKKMDQGIDVFFANRSHGVKFVEFLSKVAPVRSGHDKQLVHYDLKSNTCISKFTFSVEIPPICREDLICLPSKVAASLGNLGPLVICTKVTNNIILQDPFSLRQCYLGAYQYWRASFQPLLTSRQLVEYIVLDVEIISPEFNDGGSRCALAEVQAARLSDFGKNDNIFFIKTHLGHILKPGDHALGYDLSGANVNDIELEKYRGLVLPEAILVKKRYEEKRQRKHGKLKSVDMEVDNSGDRDYQEKVNSGDRNYQEMVKAEYERFKRQLEVNPEITFDISIYPNDEEDVHSVPVEDLFADLDISYKEDDDDMGE